MAVVLNACLISVATCVLRFEALLELSMFFYSFNAIMQCASLLRLRKTHPHRLRPRVIVPARRMILRNLAAEPLLAKTLAGVVVGIVLGAIVRATDPTPRAIELVGFPGELFMRLLRALVLPLIVVSMVCGVCSLAKGSEGSARRVATRLLAAYAITSLVGCALGLLVVSVARPGDGVSFDANGCAGAGATTWTGSLLREIGMPISRECRCRVGSPKRGPLP